MKFPHRVTFLFPIFIFIIILAGRIFLSLNRFIDPDEFAHMHWAYLISVGKLPYKDIFIYHVPLFQWVMAPIFFLSQSIMTVYLSRLSIFITLLVLSYLIFSLTRILTKSVYVAILSTLIFAAFPMTLDKTIDIRPDMLMVVFFLSSLLLILKTGNWSNKRLLLTGLLYGLSLLTFPKIIYALPCLIFLLLTALKLSGLKTGESLRSIASIRPKQKNSALIHGLKTVVFCEGGIKSRLSQVVKNFCIFFLGIVIPVFLFVIYLILNNLAFDAFISIWYNSQTITKGIAPFSLILALTPWPLVYISQGGVSFPWITNTLIWIFSVLGLLITFFKNKKLFFLCMFFLLGGLIFIYLFPVPYLQYFVPLSVFVSILAAYFILWLGNITKLKDILLIIISASLLVSFAIQFAPRKNDNNHEQLQVISDVLKISKPDETFFDMVGSYVFRPDGFFICCHHYGEFTDRLKFKVPSLEESLIRNHTKFLVMDRTALLFWQTPEPDLTFLKENYVLSSYPKIYLSGIQYTCENSQCMQHDAENKPVSTLNINTFNIIIPEKYRISTSPPQEKIFIDGKLAKEVITLSAGNHSFSVSPLISSFKIALDR